MADFGITPEGIVIKTIQDVLAEIESSQKSLFGSGFTIAPDSPQGQLNGVFGDKVAELWELLQDVARSRNPSFSTGAFLDEILQLTGTQRLAATRSIAALYLIRTGGITTIPAGSLFSIGSAGSQWRVIEETDLADGAFVDVEAVEFGPVFASARSIDSLVTPLTDLEERPFVKSLNNGPFKLFDYDTLEIQIDSDETQTIQFRDGDFSDIAAATLSEVQAAITSAFGAVESETLSQGFLLWSSTLGPGSAIQTKSGVLARLGLSSQFREGFNQPTRGTLLSGNSGPYDLTGNPEVFIKANGNQSQQVIFTSGSYGEKARGFIDAVAASDLVPGGDETFVLDDGDNGTVTFVFDDDASVTETSTTRVIAYVGNESRVQMAQKIRAAIDLSIVDVVTRADNSDNGITLLTTNRTGTARNNAITDTVASASFVVSGLASGENGSAAAVPAYRVAEFINENTTSLLAYESDGKIQIETLTEGVNGSVEVTGGAANTEFGFPVSEEQAGRSGVSEIGRNVESDAAARVRRERVLKAPGGGSVSAIQASLTNVPNVTYARVYENPFISTDSQGRPPKSVEAVVRGGADADIAEVLRKKVAGGIETYAVPGSNGVSLTLLDADGNDFEINFSRPDQVQLYVIANVQVRKGTFGGGSQSAGIQLIRDSIKEVIDELVIGNDVIALDLKCAAREVPGVADVPSLFLDIVPVPTNPNNLSIGDRSLATILLTDITVNVTFL